MPYQVEAIANRFLAIARSSGEPLDPMKIQKLVYFAHGWHLGLGGGPLCADRVEAWRWGPVFPELYHCVKRWGNRAIRKPLEIRDFDGRHYRWTTPEVSGEPDFSRRVIQRVWDVYGHMSGWALSQLTHEKGTPWDKIRASYPGMRDVEIPNELIQQYFEEKARSVRAARAGE